MTASGDLLARYRNDITVNKNRLDDECEGQADLFFNASIELAEAKENLEALERRIKLHRADLLVKIKKDPIMYNLDTASDKVAESIVVSHPTTRALEDQLSKLQSEVNIRSAFVSALDHRKRMLQELVSLHGQGYFAKVEGSPASSKRKADEEKAAARIPMKAGVPVKPKKPLPPS